MTPFICITHIIDAIIFPVFLSSYFNVQKRKQFIAYSSLVQFILRCIFTCLKIPLWIIFIFVILINILSIIINKNDFNEDYCFIVVLYSLLMHITYFDLTGYNHYYEYFAYYFVCISSKVFLVIFTLLLLRFKHTLHFKINIKQNKSFIYFIILLFVCTITNVSLLYLNTTQNISFIIFVFLIILFNLIIVMIVNKLIFISRNNIVLQQKKQQQTFDKETLKTIKNIKNEIDAIDHRLFYVVFEIDNLLNNREYDKIKKIINMYKDMLLKHKLIINTGNHSFDCLMSLKFNDLIIKNIDIKTCIFISQNEFYNNIVFINYISELLDHLYTCSFINFTLQEINNYLKISIIFEHENIDIDSLKKTLNKSIMDQFSPIYKINKNQYYELKIMMNIKNNKE